MNQARTHIGVDVGKDCLDICHPDGTKEHVGNTKRHRARLVRKAKATSAIISFEATGPYEEPLADECLAAGVPAAGLDAWKTRKYAEAQGMLEKTDAIDCETIRDFAASPKTERLRFVRPMSDGYRRLKRSAGVRRNLVKARVLVAGQLENLLDKDTKSAVIKAVEALDRQAGACHGNHRLQPIHGRFTARGMPRRVAPVALARRIAILMNHVAKYPDFTLPVDPKKSASPSLPKRKPGRPRKIS